MGGKQPRRQQWSGEVGSGPQCWLGRREEGSLTALSFPNQGEILRRKLFLVSQIDNPSLGEGIPFFPLICLPLQLLVRPRLHVRFSYLCSLKSLGKIHDLVLALARGI